MSARNDTYALMQHIAVHCDVFLDFEDANTMSRPQLTMQRWAELECGDGNDYASFSIERDDETGLPYLCTYPHKGDMRKCRIADREAGALRRIKEVCERNGLHFFHQGDPRGCALYVSHEPLPDNNYTQGVAC